MRGTQLELFLTPARPIPERPFVSFAQVVLMMVSTRSFGLEDRDECALWLSSWVLTALFTTELILRTVSKRTIAEMILSAFWWVDVISVVPGMRSATAATSS